VCLPVVALSLRPAVSIVGRVPSGQAAQHLALHQGLGSL
jgi:hypothetical protein